MENLKSEVINEGLRVRLYNNTKRKFKKEKEILEKEDAIKELIKYMYLKKFKTKKAENFIKKWPDLVKTIVIGVSLKQLNIEDYANYDNPITVSVPIYPKAYKFIKEGDKYFYAKPLKIVDEMFKDNVDLKIIIIKKLKEIAILKKEWESFVYKYYSKIRCKCDYPRYFCLDVKTTGQLKNIYPEIYEIYKEMVCSGEHVVEEKLNEDKLKKLRKSLGYV